MDIELRARLTETNDRLRAALDEATLPRELAEAAHACVIDIDCALASDVSNGSARLLLAQAAALIAVAAQSRSASG